MNFYITLALTFLSSCTSLKPYEKQYLVHPLMDDSFTADLDLSVMSRQTSKDQRLKVGGSGNSATSCPTCGG